MYSGNVEQVCINQAVHLIYFTATAIRPGQSQCVAGLTGKKPAYLTVRFPLVPEVKCWMNFLLEIKGLTEFDSQMYFYFKMCHWYHYYISFPSFLSLRFYAPSFVFSAGLSFRPSHQVQRQKDDLLLDQVRTFGTPVFFHKSFIFNSSSLLFSRLIDTAPHVKRNHCFWLVSLGPARAQQSSWSQSQCSTKTIEGGSVHSYF